jgi:hypothetical protein
MQVVIYPIFNRRTEGKEKAQFYSDHVLDHAVEATSERQGKGDGQKWNVFKPARPSNAAQGI